MSETAAHRQLKALAAQWARAHGFHAVAAEVRLPKSNYRADLAAYQRTASGQIGTTGIFECKQSRSDLLKDNQPEDQTRQALRQLDQRRQKLEDLLKLHYPTLRAGETLFTELDALHLGGHEHKNYRRVLAEIDKLQTRYADKTKFHKLTRYRIANLNYLVTEPGIFTPEEIPTGWGHLVRHGEELVLARKPIWQEVVDADRLRFLENIAARAGLNAAPSP